MQERITNSDNKNRTAVSSTDMEKPRIEYGDPFARSRIEVISRHNSNTAREEFIKNMNA